MTECSDIARLFEIGRSVEGVPIYALEISDKPGEREAEPYFRYIANMHGDEPSGRVHLVKLAEWLCLNYPDQDPRAKQIVDGMHLILVPTLNPDGFAAKMRSNSNNVDLNRDFPDRFKSDSMDATGNEQPETQAIMSFT